MVGGGFIFLLGFFGCCGAIKEWRIFLAIVNFSTSSLFLKESYMETIAQNHSQHNASEQNRTKTKTIIIIVYQFCLHKNIPCSTMFLSVYHHCVTDIDTTNRRWCGCCFLQRYGKCTGILVPSQYCCPEKASSTRVAFVHMIRRQIQHA